MKKMIASMMSIGIIGSCVGLPVKAEWRTRGDINGDGIVDSTDASIILSEYAEESIGGAKADADVNGDGITDSSDASEVLKIYVARATKEPKLGVSEAEGKVGEEVEVAITVDNAEGAWSSCGLSIFYDEGIEPKREGGEIVWERGEAAKNLSILVAENKAERQIFFATAGADDVGGTGEIIKFKFIAKEAGHYNIRIEKTQGDRFTSHIDTQKGDKAMEEYAFSHTEDGGITITD